MYINSKINAHFLIIALATIFTLVPELILVERKYGLFMGGFGQSYKLASFGEFAMFSLSLLFLYISCLSLIYWLFRKLFLNRIGPVLLVYNYLFFVILLFAVVLTVKYQVLKYFSDAISFHLIKDLGGGSLKDAFLYVRDEMALIFGSLVLVVLVYGIGLWLVRKYFSVARSTDEKVFSAKSRRVVISSLVVMLIVLMYAISGTRDVRYALSRFLVYGVFNDALAEATDFDRDGYSYFSPLKDDHPFDESRHPLALDIPGNGIDEDGFAGDFIYRESNEQLPITLSGKKQHFVLIVLESSRGDSQEKIIDGIEITPNLKKLGKEGISIGQAYSHIGFTSPSLKNLFSGSFYASDSPRSLFRDLKSNGYKIAVFSGQPETFGGISQAVGMRESADIFVDAEALKNERVSIFTAKGSLMVDGQMLLSEFDQRLGDKGEWDSPVFVYFNFQSSHFPYYHKGMKKILLNNPVPRSEINKENREWLAKTYWNSVAYADWLVSQVVSRLKTLGIYDDTLIAVTADHGESLFDDDFLGHGHFINKQQTHIPLIFNRRPEKVITEPVGLTDYYDIFMSLLGADNSDVNMDHSSEQKSVLQFIGSLDSPRVVGIVEQGEKWTILDLHSQLVSFPDLSRSVYYQNIDEYPLLKKRTDRLIIKWERERWKKHLAETAKHKKSLPGH